MENTELQKIEAEEIEIVEERGVSIIKDNNIRTIYESKLLPGFINTEAKAVVAFQYIKEIGMLDKALNVMNNLYFVNGKISLMTPGMALVLGTKGVTHRLIRDYENVFVTNDPRLLFLNGSITLNDKQQPIPVTYYSELTKTTEILKATTIEFTYKGEKTYMNYTNKEAEDAGNMTKTIWKAYTKTMMRWRCYSSGAKFLFPALLAGISSPEELDAKFDTTPEFEEIVKNYD